MKLFSCYLVLVLLVVVSVYAVNNEGEQLDPEELDLIQRLISKLQSSRAKLNGINTGNCNPNNCMFIFLRKAYF